MMQIHEHNHFLDAIAQGFELINSFFVFTIFKYSFHPFKNEDRIGVVLERNYYGA